MHPRRLISFVSFAILALVVLACGSAGTPGTTTNSSPVVAPTTAAGADSGSLGDPIQLSFDPCTLVTQAEATATLGMDVTQIKFDNGGGGACNYLGVGSPSHLTASLPSVADCKLLFLQIDKNLFGDVQQRIDGIGDGGMLVAGDGNLQIAIHHGCFEIDAGTADTPLPDATMLDLARTAATRVP